MASVPPLIEEKLAMNFPLKPVSKLVRKAANLTMESTAATFLFSRLIKDSWAFLHCCAPVFAFFKLHHVVLDEVREHFIKREITLLMHNGNEVVLTSYEEPPLGLSFQIPQQKYLPRSENLFLPCEESTCLWRKMWNLAWLTFLAAVWWSYWLHSP